MKLSVRKKVANGLVLFLLLPRAAETAVELFDAYSGGLKSFGAEDEFDLTAGKGNFAVAQVNADPAGDPSGGDPTGGDPTGGDPTGGDPTGGDPTGGDPTGGDPTGGDPTGGDPTGGDPTGGDPTGGDPTGGDPTGGDPTGGDPSGYDPSAYDPSGFDPSGGDPSSCEPGSTIPLLTIDAPRLLVTAEDGTADLFEMHMAPDPDYLRTYRIVSTRPDEARPVPDVVTFGDNACIPRPVWVTGQNDYKVDGDVDYTIYVLDEQDFPVGSIKGVNLDNDDYAGVAVDVLGPNALPEGGDGLFLVRVANVSGGVLPKSTLFIEPSSGLQINDYAVALLSGKAFRDTGKLKDGVLTFAGVVVEANDMLIVSLGVELVRGGPASQALAARFVNDRSGEETNDDQDVRTARP
jgi:hypothetical protein